MGIIFEKPHEIVASEFSDITGDGRWATRPTELFRDYFSWLRYKI